MELELEKYKQIIGIRIKQRRMELGITQIGLAEATGIGKPQISKIEAGINFPSIQSLILIKIALLIDSFDYFFNGQGIVLKNNKNSIDND